MLQNGFIECEQEQCPDVRHCYTQMPKEGCCVKCKGTSTLINTYIYNPISFYEIFQPSLD